MAWNKEKLELADVMGADIPGFIELAIVGHELYSSILEWVLEDRRRRHGKPKPRPKTRKRGT